jgi:thiosulfate/3-mercaptopyruvate sulfurtransferase
MNGSTLVSTAELAANYQKWRVFDCRHDLAKPELGEQQYRESHIPGALFASLDRDLSGRKTGTNGRHPLPEPQDFEKWLETTGLTPKDQVVCYDAGNGSMASRLWWMLRWIGHDKVAVLDGGYAKWTKEGRPVTVDVPQGLGPDVTVLVRRVEAYLVD